MAGVTDGMEQAIRFVEFCRASSHEPTIQAIRMRFDVSRNTAYRWRRAYRDAHGLHARRNRGAW